MVSAEGQGRSRSEHLLLLADDERVVQGELVGAEGRLGDGRSALEWSETTGTTTARERQVRRGHVVT